MLHAGSDWRQLLRQTQSDNLPLQPFGLLFVSSCKQIIAIDQANKCVPGDKVSGILYLRLMFVSRNRQFIRRPA